MDQGEWPHDQERRLPGEQRYHPRQAPGGLWSYWRRPHLVVRIFSSEEVWSKDCKYLVYWQKSASSQNNSEIEFKLNKESPSALSETLNFQDVGHHLAAAYLYSMSVDQAVIMTNTQAGQLETQLSTGLVLREVRGHIVVSLLMGHLCSGAQTAQEAQDMLQITGQHTAIYI